MVTYLMVTYDGAPGELMIGIKEEHHELIGYGRVLSMPQSPRHSQEQAKGENRDLYKEEVIQKLLVY